MDFGWSEQERDFRAEVRAFIGGNWKAGTGHDWEPTKDGDATSAYQQALADHGWLTMAWPEEYGGKGASYVEQVIFNEESVLTGAPRGGQGASLVGPTLMIFGTEEQKLEHLPKIARNEIRWRAELLRIRRVMAYSEKRCPSTVLGALQIGSGTYTCLGLNKSDNCIRIELLRIVLGGTSTCLDLKATEHRRRTEPVLTCSTH